MAFLSSQELPTVAPLPTIALPLIKAQCLISASSQMIKGPVKRADFVTIADFAIQISSPTLIYLSSLKVGPIFKMKSLISGKTSQGYSCASKSSFAIV